MYSEQVNDDHSSGNNIVDGGEKIEDPSSRDSSNIDRTAA